MPVQDDARELEMLRLFNLRVAPERKRGDDDAYLRMDGTDIPFELKSTTSGSVSTVRDFGPDHVRKWRGKHWIFGFYDRSGATLRYSCYGSPARMEPWIRQLEGYVRPDAILADTVPERVSHDVLVRVLGDKPAYTYEEARSIAKNQYGAAKYRELMDLPDQKAYSPGRMLEILRERCRYVLLRGSTLNNPHIPAGYFKDWEQITEDHAMTLRRLVGEYLQSSAETTEQATE
jgi:hypothetical protein